MEIDRLILGAYETNCYILRSSERAEDCLIIDTGLEATALVNFLGEHKLSPLAIALTHGHIDHITGVSALVESFPGIKVGIHKLDAEMLSQTQGYLLAPGEKSVGTICADFYLEEPVPVEQAGIKLQVLHTPGHTPGGVCLYSEDEKILFSGDTLFAGSVGRTDMPGGSMEQLIKSIREKLLVLPEDTVIYPGHGPATTIAQEKAYNPYCQ